MSYTKLQAHHTRHTATGVQVSTFSVTVQLADETVDIPIPFLPISDNLGVAPVMEHGANDGNTIRVDLSRWQPICLRDGEARCLPLELGQADAVTITRAFDADPTTTWNDSRTAVETWTETYEAGTQQ